MSEVPVEKNTVVLPLDSTARSAAVLPVAETVIRLAQAIPCVVQTEMPPTPIPGLKNKFPGLKTLLEHAIIAPPRENPAEAIIRAATENHSLCIVMAMHEGQKKADTGLDAIAEEVLREMPCPVVLVPPERGAAPWRVRQVVLPQDGTPVTARAAAPAIALAGRAGAGLLVLHVSGAHAVSPQEPGSLTAPRYVDQPQHEWPAWAREFLDRVRSLSGEHPVKGGIQMCMAHGEPGPEIVRFARGHRADLIVLSWRGELAPRCALTLRYVLQHAPCPILVLPESHE
ncbi:universal stress protein [Methylocaldum szegediense]|jgi:nucleotide-binding universal stress UspA family protein|uniref:Nucleotide-binding universal stress UspA family protein n=1 Tax=Methylocaldum szegediense TaxID=73780 RepID=A0ABN8X1Z3_9GAMM|nr:universal stress protein [Methylocaldum szegediense]CAI8814353.1 Nucleotide-binding universal stress UspA family protein [Methylocaldum szegediense]